VTVPADFFSPANGKTLFGHVTGAGWGRGATRPESESRGACVCLGLGPAEATGTIELPRLGAARLGRGWGEPGRAPWILGGFRIGSPASPRNLDYRSAPGPFFCC